MNIHKIREDFPILSRTVYGKPLVYLDNGATTQKPRLVIDSIVDEYYSVNANVHRGVHFLSQQATELHEASRETVRQFINARSTREVIFTRGTTESINLIVSSFGEEFMQEGDEVIVSVMEHHSNIVPWQLLAARYEVVRNGIDCTGHPGWAVSYSAVRWSCIPYRTARLANMAYHHRFFFSRLVDWRIDSLG